MAVTDEGLGNTAWVADLGAGAVVIDPERDPTPYQAAAARSGAEIVLAVETHLHADFVTGSRELAAAGASVAAAAGGHMAWPHRPVADRDEIDFGKWKLRALATPGHTPEHLSFLLLDGDRPRAVFTGGALMVGSVARTDLIDPHDTDALTRDLWRSINDRLLSLPDDVVVLPTHGAGSFCAAAPGGPRWTTIGYERASNPLLQARDEDDFVRGVLAGFGTYPPYFRRLRAVNQSGPHVYGTFPRLADLEPAAVARVTHEQPAQREAIIVDVRPVADYAAGHIPGSIANTLRPQFASWLGWLVDDLATPLIFVTDASTDRRELVRQCLNIGYERLVGAIDFGSWVASGGEPVATELVAAHELGARRVLDVRQTAEFSAGHVPGATHVELGSLGAEASSLPHQPTVVMCGHGERAATAASLLEAAGHHELAILDGGPEEWSALRREALART